MSTTPKPYIPLRSPSPVDSSSDDLNELSLEQELAQLERPHFLDYTQVGIPYPATVAAAAAAPTTTTAAAVAVVNDQPPPIPPRHPLTNSLPLNRRSSIPIKMIRSADNVPLYDANGSVSGKKHFLDENPIRPDYDYVRSHRSLDREHERKEYHRDSNAIKMQFDARRHSADRQKPKKIKEPSYTMSRFLETDDGLNQYNDNEVSLGDVNLHTNTSDRSVNFSSSDDCVYSLLSMIGCNNPIEMSKKFLDLSKTPHTCANLRHSHCISLLVQMIHCGADDLTRQQSREALRNVVNFHPDDKVGRREAKVLRYIEQIMDYCDLLKKFKDNESDRKAFDSESHPLQAMSSLMKVSFDEEHRHSMCTLGALQTIANLLHFDHAVHGTNANDAKCISLRRYAGMALTNLTFGDGNNKALLCANRDFMEALVAQINTDADDLLQVTANVLRNLSWRADNNMKTVLNEIGTVTALTLAAMKNKNENTLRAILSALWNLSAHCSNNKAEFCMVDGALLFLVEMLTYESPSKTLSIVENAGGILRNVSSHIAVNENFRKILRQRNCLGNLLQQLKSESLTIVSNACGTLWNLSARCPEDQKFLWDNGAVPMLRSLIHSKHRMISNGSKVALKNLVNFRPGEMNRSGLDPVAKMMGLKELPTLSVRKQRALEDELDENLSETCENIEVTKTPPPLTHQKATKNFTVVERDQQHIERSFGHLSMQCNERQKSNNEFWETKSFPSNSNNNFNQSAVQHPTGTIPKRTIQVDETVANTVPPDQITNFSLVYSETHPEIRDVKEQKNRTFSVAEEDTVKCYDNEGTPHLSTATSISDLRPLPKHPVAHNMHRNSKSGRTTTENSGINTPERPINYCEEGTPAYFSRRDSFSSLHEENEFIQENIELTHKPNQLNILAVHKNDDGSSQANDVDRSQHDYDNNSSNNCTVPTTPGECASKTVTFNEFNLETPMMFSRHSSLGSLASHEPPLNDEIGSVISETSRMPSGIISPSEIPDSPSQTMPPSPRQKHCHSCDNGPNQRRLPFEDEVRTFGVENTPALISCATSLSNLSLDDEPKIANDLLIKEMRLMHHPSDEQDDEPNVIASTSADQNVTNPNFDTNVQNNCDAGEALSDSDDSINDDDSLLKNCISMGIQAKQIDPDIKSPPVLPEPNGILQDLSSSDDEDPVDLLEQCIRTGITKTVALPDDSHTLDIGGVKLTPQQIFKENPIGMLRKGGNQFIRSNFDETDRFHIEDSPCSYSIASGLSDLTVGSHRAGPLKANRLPSTQSNANPNCEIASDSDESINDDGSLLKNCILMGIQAKTIEPVGNVKLPPGDSSSDDDGQVDLLEQCIRTGITKNSVKPESSGRLEIGAKLPPQHIVKENPIGMLRKGGNSFIETTYDETNRFYIEDSPCNRSIASGLSDLTVGSHTVGLLKVNRLPSIQSDTNEETDGDLNGQRSLSPLSVDSEEGRQLLQQAFAAGQARIVAREKSSNATSSQSSSAVTVQNVGLVEPNADAPYDDSHSSISSIDSNDSNTLLQQCIQAGMGKANQISASKSKIAIKSPSKVVTSNQTKRSQLPTPKASTSQPTSNHRSRSTKRGHDDKQLVMDYKTNGIERSIRSKSTAVEKCSPLKRIESEHLKNLPSKNAHTTSATVSHTVGATDVVKDKQKGTAYAHDQYQPVDRLAQISSTSTLSTATTTTTTTIWKKDHEKSIILITDDIIEITAPAMAEIGCSNNALNTSMMSTKSHNSFNMGGDMSLLERSNEYPALLGQNESIYDSQHSSSVDMEVSNECLFENLSPPKMDKHKDPNLMLQSVERLTQELVSTAEYLRTNNSLDDDITITESKQTFSVSNDTWNDDTNPNAVSFPKMSKEAPVIASMHDDDTTISELNGSRYEMANSEFIEDSTPINNKTFSESISDRKSDSNGLRFEIGGIVNQLNSGTYNCNGFDSHSTASTMTNSTIIAMEANKIRNQLMNDNKTDSMISLDKIRPPSVMEKMNNSSYCDSLNGASSLNRSPARFLTQGFMARRALQSNGNNSALGSTDSINSSLNLDKVKPPSIMDDLLDSMISVDSIRSEVIEHPQSNPNEEPSNYETAFSECDDMTTTLKNCVDLPLDGENSTPCGSDFSSVESTPKKGRRSLTPRRKRQLTKDRYQTYTISSANDAQQSSEDQINEAQGGDVFKMQLSNHPLLINGNDSDAISLVSSDGEMSSIRAFTKNLPYLNDISIHDDVSIHNDVSINTNTYTKLPRGSILNSLQSTPMPSGDFYDSLPMDYQSSNASSKTGSPNRTVTKSPRIVKPSTKPAERADSPSQIDETKAIRGRKKPAYVSPYSMTKLNKASPQTKEVIKPIVTPKPLEKAVTPKVETAKSVTKTVESKAKSFIQRSAESLKKMRPTFTTKLTKQSPTKKSDSVEKMLDRQKSTDSTISSETLVRQGTFIKDEPSGEIPGEIPYIVSEPTSPKKTKTLVSRIPFNRATSLQTGRNVTKSHTNIEIPLQKNASATFIRRSIKSASSTSQISSSSSRGSLSPRQSFDSPSTSKSIFNRWAPPNKKVSPLPATTTKLSATKTSSRESIGTPSAPKPPATKVGVRLMANASGKAVSKIVTPRTMSTNGRTMKV